MYVTMKVIPETEASFHGGNTELIKYVKKNIIEKLPAIITNNMLKAKIVFTINETGEVINAKISHTSGDPKTDNFLIDQIGKMPAWKPAENQNGKKVSQEFEFNVGNGGC